MIHGEDLSNAEGESEEAEVLEAVAAELIEEAAQQEGSYEGSLDSLVYKQSAEEAGEHDDTHEV